MLRGECFVFIGLQPWDLPIGSTAKNVAMEVSRHNRVLFVNPPLTRSEWLMQRTDKKVRSRLEVIVGQKESIEQVTPSLWVFTPRKVTESVNFIEPHSLYKHFNKMNDRRLAGEIVYACAQLEFREYIIFNDNSMLNGYYLKEMLNPKLYIYLLRDNVIAVDYHKKHGRQMQEELVGKADLVFANSDYFADYCRKYNPKTFMIGQGCDLSLYSDPDGTLAIAPELTQIPHPIVGYTGSLTSRRLDLKLLEDIANDRPEWSLVLVGPEDDSFKRSTLHQLKHVHFIPTQPVDRLPSFIKGFDVAINPQAVNIITNWNYPLKIDEYLALGRAVVATKTVFMSYFGNHVYLATGVKEYLTKIEQALSEDSAELQKSRISYVGTHTWENFVGKIYDQINSIASFSRHKV